MYFREFRVGTFRESFQGPLKVDFSFCFRKTYITPVMVAQSSTIYFFSVESSCLLEDLSNAPTPLTPPDSPWLLLGYFVFSSNSPPRFQLVATTTDWAVVRLPPSMFNPIMPPHTQT